MLLALLNSIQCQGFVCCLYVGHYLGTCTILLLNCSWNSCLILSFFSLYNNVYNYIAWWNSSWWGYGCLFCLNPQSTIIIMLAWCLKWNSFQVNMIGLESCQLPDLWVLLCLIGLYIQASFSGVFFFSRVVGLDFNFTLFCSTLNIWSKLLCHFFALSLNCMTPYLRNMRDNHHWWE